MILWLSRRLVTLRDQTNHRMIERIDEALAPLTLSYSALLLDKTQKIRYELLKKLWLPGLIEMFQHLLHSHHNCHQQLQQRRHSSLKVKKHLIVPSWREELELLICKGESASALTRASKTGSKFSKRQSQQAKLQRLPGWKVVSSLRIIRISKSKKRKAVLRSPAK